MLQRFFLALILSLSLTAGAFAQSTLQGNTFSGTTYGKPPSATTGAEGSYFLDSATNNLYGPKTSDQWPTAPTSRLGSSTANSSSNIVCQISDSYMSSSSQVTSQQFTVAGGTGPYSQVTTGLPTNVTEGYSTPIFTFSPGARFTPGVYPMSFTITDSASHTSVYSSTLTIDIFATMTWTTPSLTSGSALLTMTQTLTQVGNSDWGPQFWIPFLTRNQWVAPRNHNYSIAGDTTGNILARLPVSTATATNPSPLADTACGVYLTMSGTNDLGAFTAPQIEANLMSIWTQLLSTGKPVIALVTQPRYYSPPSVSFQQKLFAIQRWMRAQTGTIPNLTVLDTTWNYADPFSPTGQPRELSARVLAAGGTGGGYTYAATGLPTGVTLDSATGTFVYGSPTADSTNQVTVTATDSGSNTGTQVFTLSVNRSQSMPLSLSQTGAAGGTLTISTYWTNTFDGNHPVAIGAQQFFGPIATTLNALYPQPQSPFYNVSDTYDATNNVKGNLLTNGMMGFQAGTGIVFNRITGVVPDGWIFASADNGCNPCNWAGVGSASTLADGSPAVQLAITSSSTGMVGGFQTQMLLQQTLTPSNINAGDALTASCAIEVAAGAYRVTSPQLSVQFTSGAQTYVLTSGSYVNVNGLSGLGSNIPNTAYSGVISTPLPATVLPVAPSGTLYFQIFIYATQTGAVPANSQPNVTSIANNAQATIKIGKCTLSKV